MARIVAIVNRYDNLCNPGAHTAALTPHEAVAMLFAQGRTRYDTTVLTTVRRAGVFNSKRSFWIAFSPPPTTTTDWRARSTKTGK